jgi:hypothetical protein
MKWEKDLVRDIRTHDEKIDNSDSEIRDIPHPLTEIYGPNSCPPEVSNNNRWYLTNRFMRVRDQCQAILEIGVCRNGGDSFAHRFLQNKLDETIYIGIDIDDKSFLNNPEKNIYTIKGDSSNVKENIDRMKSWGVKEFGFIFIDGWHSINQVLTDWEYTELLAPHGIVGFHDTTFHPGPKAFVEALNKDIWEVEENLCKDDNGIGFAWRKGTS